MKNNTWFVLEAQKWRIQKSLSDLNGTDVYVHGGTPDGVFRELAKAFVRETRQPTFIQLRSIYQEIMDTLPKFLDIAGSDDPFQARVFQDVSVYAGVLAQNLTA